MIVGFCSVMLIVGGLWLIGASVMVVWPQHGAPPGVLGLSLGLAFIALGCMGAKKAITGR